jgi:DNA (cytosine-5)-methyltransferase 1
MENVKGLLLAKRGAFHREILDIFRELGYVAEGRVLNAADYGVPQLRERVIYLASRAGGAPRFPDPTHFPADSLEAEWHKPYRTVRDALGDLPLLGDEHLEQPIGYATPPMTDYQEFMRGEFEGVTWHVARRVSRHALGIISRVPQGAGIRSIPQHELPDRFKRMRTISSGALRRDCTTLYHRLSWDRPAYTITCYFRNVSAGPFVHPIDNRALSCREAARLQAFPDWYEFEGAHVPHQIGNAVPPLLARAVGEALQTTFARGFQLAA